MAIETKEEKSLWEIEVIPGGVSLTQKAVFAKQLSVMLKSGISITETLNIARDSASGKLRKVIGKVLKSVEAGSSLSASFARYPRVFSSLFIGATKTGEASGTLVENLENVAEQLRKKDELISKIKGAMLYPTIILIAAFILGIVLVFFVLPKIIPLFEGLKIDLPITTRILIWLSHFIKNNGSALFLVISSLLILMNWSVRQNFSKPVTHWFSLNIPGLKDITLNSNLSDFSRTLGMLLKSGVNIDEALEIIENTTENYYYKQALKKVSQNVRKGTTVSENLTRFGDLFPEMLTRMIKVGEEAGRFEETLFYLANFYEVKVNNATKSLSTTIEPILLLMIGLVVGFLALSIITPIYDVTSGIRK